jgi:hypothetical protein
VLKSKWIEKTDLKLDRNREIIATFIIDLDGQLWIADRHSEHLYCARYENVLSAGEITFSFDRDNVEVSEVTNQSTGYCPEVESWQVVASALDRVNLLYPNFFTTEFIFRLCDRCRTTNIIKYNCFECSVCSEKLSEQWNYD